MCLIKEKEELTKLLSSCLGEREYKHREFFFLV